MLIGTTVTIYVPIYLQHRSHPLDVSCSFFIQSCCSQNERQCSCKQAFFRYFYCLVIIFYYPSSKYRMIHSLITDSIRFCISVFFDWKEKEHWDPIEITDFLIKYFFELSRFLFILNRSKKILFEHFCWINDLNFDRMEIMSINWFFCKKWFLLSNFILDERKSEIKSNNDFVILSSQSGEIRIIWTEIKCKNLSLIEQFSRSFRIWNWGENQRERIEYFTVI